MRLKLTLLLLVINAACAPSRLPPLVTPVAVESAPNASRHYTLVSLGGLKILVLDENGLPASGVRVRYAPFWDGHSLSSDGLGFSFSNLDGLADNIGHGKISVTVESPEAGSNILLLNA